MLSLNLILASFIHAAPIMQHGIYDADKNKLIPLSYEKITASRQFIEGCTNGICELLHIDGTPIGINGIPEQASVSMPFDGLQIYLIEANGKKTYFYDSKKIPFPERYSNLRPFELITNGSSILCRDTQVVSGTKMIDDVVFQKGKYKKVKHQVENLEKRTECHDFSTGKDSIYAFKFDEFYFNSPSINIKNAWNKGEIRKSNGEVIKNLHNCEYEYSYENDSVLSCCDMTENQNCSPDKQRKFNRNLEEIPKTKGVFKIKYKNIEIYSKYDSFGGDSNVVYHAGKKFRAFGHSDIFPILNRDGFCVGYPNIKDMKCFDISKNIEFRVPLCRGNYIHIFDTTNASFAFVDKDNRLIETSDAIYKAMKANNDQIFLKNNILIYSNMNEMHLDGKGIYQMDASSREKLEPQKIVGFSDGYIYNAGSIFIFGISNRPFFGL